MGRDPVNSAADAHERARAGDRKTRSGPSQRPRHARGPPPNRSRTHARLRGAAWGAHGTRTHPSALHSQVASENRSLGERSIWTRARAASAASGATGALGTPPTPPGPAPPSPTAALPVEPLKCGESVRERQLQRVSTVHEKGGCLGVIFEGGGRLRTFGGGGKAAASPPAVVGQ